MAGILWWGRVVQTVLWGAKPTLMIAVVAASALDLPLASGRPQRDFEPVVMSGARVPHLCGATVGEIVAFRYQDGWAQLPVQIDERVIVDFASVYGLSATTYPTLAYADTETFTGPDDDSTFDANDELVVMAGDAFGTRVTRSDSPAWTFPDTGVELMITDPISGEVGFVYLLHGDGTWDQAAGQDNVSYEFDLLAGDYLTHYDTDEGPNPEDSEVVTDYYRTHFSDRWVRDEVNVYAGTSTGVDILDRHTNLFGPGVCSRSEDTFSAGEGAFFCNIDGPVRAIRSYLGANSGPLTQRDHFFYARRQTIVTTLRVHEIPGVMDLYDYSPDAAGMYYYSSLNPIGVIVDGFEDTPAAGPILWEMVTGLQGTLIMVHSVETDIDALTHTSYYSDDSAPETTPCTGDAFEFGVSGVWVDAPIPNTDPYWEDHKALRTTRTVHYSEPGQTVADAAARAEEVNHPFEIRVRPFPPPQGDVNDDCRIDAEDYVEFLGCLSVVDACIVSTCATLDWENDCTVTLSDFARFQREFTGSSGVLYGCEP